MGEKAPTQRLSEAGLRRKVGQSVAKPLEDSGRWPLCAETAILEVGLRAGAVGA
jgi:hypothetical protein